MWNQPKSSLSRSKTGFVILMNLIFMLFYGLEAFGAQVSEDFSLLLNKDSGTLEWNLSQQALHPPLKIKNYVTAGNVTLTRNFEIGSGKHGVFDSTTYSSFSKNGDTSGNIVRLDTSVHSPLQVKSFQLDAGWTLQPVGDAALTILSQGNVIIDGTIDCSGGHGESFMSIGTKASGGTGRCGGGDGGDGSYVVSAVTIEAGAGGFLGATVVPGKPSAGLPASAHGKGSGGGGGGSYTANAAASVAEPGTAQSTGTGGAKGDVEPDHSFQFVGGGAGGGGGDHRLASGLSGGGGGAGGGVVVIHAFGDIKISPTGSITANGGNGGGSASQNSGAGGGGGGGSIRLFALGDVYASGPVRANRGTGGSNSLGVSGGRGGAGRTWLAGKSGYSQALPPHALNAEKPDTLLAHVGYGRFQTGTFTLSSKPLDSMSTRPSVTGVTLTTSLSSGASSQLEISSGESNDFVPVSWVSSASITDPQSRYLRFRTNLTNADESSGAYIQNVQILYSPYYQQEFDFNQGGCGRVSDFNGDEPSLVDLFFLVLILIAPLALALKLKTQSIHNL